MSFSPDKLLDGTNEVLAILLLTPFAQSHETIFVGYFIIIYICLIISAIYIFKIIKRIFPKDYKSISVIIPIVLSSTLFLKTYFGNTLSGGFFNILSVSLFLITIYSMISEKYKKMSFFAFLCAFSRFDSIAWLFAVFVADTIVKRKINWRLILSSLIGFITLLLFFKVYYGYFIPTPVLAKNNTPLFFDIFLTRLEIISGFIMYISIFILSGFILSIYYKYKITNEKLFFYLLFLFGLLGSCIIVLKDHGHQHSTYRYILPFIFLIFICFVLASNTFLNFIINRYKKIEKVFVVLPLVFITFLSMIFFIQIDKDKYFKKKNTYDRYRVGEFLSKDLSIMSSEVSLMFYPRDNKNVIETWGFVNRDVTKEKDKCFYYTFWGGESFFAKYFIKKLISKYNPNIVFVGEVLTNNNNIDKYSYESLANNSNINYLDKNEISYIKNNYKIVFINHVKDKYNYFILVENTFVDNFEKYIISKGGSKKTFKPKESYYDPSHKINSCDE